MWVFRWMEQLSSRDNFVFVSYICTYVMRSQFFPTQLTYLTFQNNYSNNHFKFHLKIFLWIFLVPMDCFNFNLNFVRSTEMWKFPPDCVQPISARMRLLWNYPVQHNETGYTVVSEWDQQDHSMLGGVQYWCH